MPNLAVKHLVFTRVEPAYSPRRTAGYQTIYYSQDLEPEVEQIEKRLQCYQQSITPGEQRIRYQFFWSERRQVVLSKSLTLFSPDRQVIDREGRNAFLAHALIFSQADFASLRNDPFAVFDAAEQAPWFVQSVSQIAALPTSELTKHMEVAPRTQPTHLPTGWSPQEVHQLYTLGEAAPTLNAQKKALLMVASDPVETFQLLRALFLLLPPAERAACTFDTYVDSCMPPAGTFWTLGATKVLSNSNLLPMRLEEHRAASFKYVLPPSMYAAWLTNALYQSPNFEALSNELYSAQIVAEAFQNRQALPDEPLSAHALQTIADLNQAAIKTSLQRALSAVSEKSLAEILLSQLAFSFSQAEILTMAAQGSCNPARLAPILYRWCLQNRPEWKKWEDVLKFAEKAENAPLLLLSSLKAHPGRLFVNYEKQQLQALQFLQENANLSPVLDELTASPLLNDEEFQSLVQALLRQKLGAFLAGSCIQRASTLQNAKVVQSLYKAVIAEKKEPVAPEFGQILQHHPLLKEER